MELTDEETETLVELYRSQENLYNNTLVAYNDRRKIKESLQYISAVVDKGWTEETTKAKLKWLRNGYTRIRNRSHVKGSQRNGASTDEDLKPKWKWYSRLDSFLRPFCKVVVKGGSHLSEPLQATENGHGSQDHCSNQFSEDSRMGDSDDDTDPDPSSSEQQVQGITRNSMTRLEMKREPDGGDTSQGWSVLQEMVGQMKENAYMRRKDAADRREAREPKSDNDLYCVYLASQLDKLSRVNQIKARKKIDDILFEVTMQEAEEGL